MTIEILVPDLPESVADATVATWHKQPGDAVERDEVLVDIETDKVVLEVPAPEAGVLKRLLKPKAQPYFLSSLSLSLSRVLLQVSQQQTQQKMHKRLLISAIKLH